MVNKLISSASKKLSNSDTPLLDARVLFAHAVGCRDALLYFGEVTDEQKKLFESYIKKRAQGIPVSYITGEKEFMGLRFFLNESTLIPRPDTECLIEKVLMLNKIDNPKILDLCTGSGCIGISLAKFIEKAEVVLSDVSLGALKMATKNAEENGVLKRTAIKQIDVLKDEIKEGFDIITANPPYIETDVLKTLDVSKFEPTLALDGGRDGLIFYREIVKKAHNALNSGGLLAFEIGYNQGESVSKLLCKDFKNIEITKDYGGNDRVVTAIKKDE